jgi:hypothetical protein
MLDISRMTQKRHTNLPPLESDAQPSKNGNTHRTYDSPPEIADGRAPTPDVRRYRLDEDGWKIEPDWNSPQKRTVPYDVIFDGSRYWHLKGEIWEDLNTDATKLRLVKQHELDKSRGYPCNNELESAVEFINHYNRVAAVYAIGGYTPGLYCIAPGRMILVPTGFTMIEPDPAGGCFGLLRLLRQILPKDRDGRDQLRYAIAMWKVRRQTLNDRSFAPGQVQVFVGPKNCGKTWIQEQLITPLLGGREGEPFTYLSGETRFNDDLLGAEHLKMSDEIATPEADKRRTMGTKLKGFIFNTSKRVEAKGATPLGLSTRSAM